ncbi:MAG TPA: hypothetical protein VFT98_15115 [Myxococcota bacterium]|nr:hypothetical protein [Myxococcota bacterium]
MRRVRLAPILCACAALAARAESPVPETLPVPYSADQIRERWVVGFRLETRTLAGETESLERTEVLAADAEQVSMRFEFLGADGEPAKPPQEFSAKWSELRDHALFEAAKATRERAECRSQLGTQPGWRYATSDANGDALSMCFADAAPGPPVEHETRRDGKLLSRTEHISYGVPSTASEPASPAGSEAQASEP